MQGSEKATIRPPHILVRQLTMIKPFRRDKLLDVTCCLQGDITVASRETKESHVPTKKSVITIGTGLLLLGMIAIGLLFLVIGAGTRNRPVTLIGEFIFPLALFAGGLFWGEENLAVRITLLALGGLFVIATFGNLNIF